MQDSRSYNAEVRELFSNLTHAGDLTIDSRQIFVVEVQESAEGARLVLFVCVNKGTIAQTRFRAWGCPHFLAGAEVVCREMEGVCVDAPYDARVQYLMKRLDVPVQKTGKMLLIEDAAQQIIAAIQ